MENDSMAFVEKFLSFHFRLWQWRQRHYIKEFNINGRGEHELTARKFAILWMIYKIGVSTLSELEGKVETSKSSLSTTISRLASDGYIKKTAPPKGDDRRKVYLGVTEKGKRAVDKAYGRVCLGFGSFYDSLEENKRMELDEGIDRLMKVFE